MKRVFCLVMLLSMILVMACNSSRMNGNTEGKYIEQRIRKFRKNPSDENLRREIEELYVVAVNQHEARLKAIQSTYDFSRFDRLISEYNEMQRVSDLIRLSPAGSFINTKNYFSEIESVKVTAAEYLYDEALKSMTLNDRTQLKNAWRNFNRISKYVSSFRDADIKIKEVFDRATLEIVVKPV